MLTSGTEHVSAVELQKWMSDPKERKLVYCTGELSRTCSVVASRNKNHPICQVREVLWSAWRAGIVVLVQRALGPPGSKARRFEYIAIKRLVPVRSKRHLESIFL